MKQTTTLLLAILCSINTAFGNDGVYFMNGNQLVPLTETSIKVTKEILTISLNDNGIADIDVYYEFFNDGMAKNVIMGFEANAPYNSGDSLNPQKEHPYISNFSVSMNGQTLNYSKDICRLGSTDGKPLDLTKWKYSNDYGCGDAVYNAQIDSVVSFAYVYKFNANFHPGKNIVKHKYSYKMSYSIGNQYIVDYKLTPATRWANHCIDDFTLRINAHNTVKQFYFPTSTFPKNSFRIVSGKGKISHITHFNIPETEITLYNGSAELHATHFKPTEELYLRSSDEMVVFRDIKQTKYEGAVVVNNKTLNCEGRLLRVNADTYTIEVQDEGEIPRKGNTIVIYRAKDGDGSLYSAMHKVVNIRKEPTTSSPKVGQITYEGDLPECFECLGLQNGWFHVNYFGTEGYVRVDLIDWDSICTF